MVSGGFWKLMLLEIIVFQQLRNYEVLSLYMMIEQNNLAFSSLSGVSVALKSITSRATYRTS